MSACLPRTPLRCDSCHIARYVWVQVLTDWATLQKDSGISNPKVRDSKGTVCRSLALALHLPSACTENALHTRTRTHTLEAMPAVALTVFRCSGLDTLQPSISVLILFSEFYAVCHVTTYRTDRWLRGFRYAAAACTSGSFPTTY